MEPDQRDGGRLLGRLSLGPCHGPAAYGILCDMASTHSLTARWRAESPNAWRVYARKLGRNLTRAREAAGLTHREVAAAFHLDIATSMRWHSGEITPSLRKLRDIARLYGAPLYALIPAD